ncbi:MAG: DUF1801 domain-containing protein [Bacteroidota bacterium]
MSVAGYLAALPADLRPVAEALRAIILSTAPGIEELIKYKIPFYHHQGPLCYLNKQPEHMVLGLAKGAELSNASGILTGTGNTVRHVRVYTIQDLPEAAIREVLQEAILLNGWVARQKKRR